MDFVFDRVGGGRAIKNLVIVDDATHETIAMVPAHRISGQQVVSSHDILRSKSIRS